MSLSDDLRPGGGAMSCHTGNCDCAEIDDGETCDCDCHDPIQDQLPPRQGSGPPIWELVIVDMVGRDMVGRERYGRPLQANNGRDSLVDAYQEALDLCVYLRQAIEERNKEASDDER